MGAVEQHGATYYCPNCLCGIRIAFPVEPLYSADQVCAFVPCTYRWLRNQHRYSDIIGDPIYMLDADRRRHRMYRATEVRNLRVKRMAQFSRQRNRMKATYDTISPAPAYKSQSDAREC